MKGDGKSRGDAAAAAADANGLDIIIPIFNYCIIIKHLLFNIYTNFLFNIIK
jgi:hypothetical protein